MKNKLRNLFFLIGVVAVAVMLWKFEMPYDQVLQNVQRAGIWFPAVLLLWGIIYFMNTCAWQVILNAGDTQTQARVPFWKVYKYTASHSIMSLRSDCWVVSLTVLWRSVPMWVKSVLLRV